VIDFGETYQSPNYEVRDLAGVLANAGTVTATVTLPDLTTASPTVNNSSTGVYNFDYLTVQAGRHQVLVSATGGVFGTLVKRWTDEFTVSPADPSYIVSLADVKLHLNIPAATTTHDEELRRWIGAATGIVENHPDIGVGAVMRRTVTGERQRHDYGRISVWLNQSPVISVTTVTPVATGGTAITVPDLDVPPSGEVRYKDGYTRFPAGTYLWTYVIGRVVILDEMTGAALILVKGMWETQRGAAGVPWQGGAEVAEMPGMGVYLWRAKMLLAPHKQAPAVA